MAKCLRCGAGNEWIEGDKRKAPLSFNTHVSGALPLAEKLLSSIESANPNEDYIINDLYKQCKKLVKELKRQ